MSTASRTDTTTCHTSEDPSKGATVNDLDMSTTEDRADSEDAAYADALEILNGGF